MFTLVLTYFFAKYIVIPCTIIQYFFLLWSIFTRES